MSILTMSQYKTFRSDYYFCFRPETLIAIVRYDDSCSNGHNTFSITGEVYQPYKHPNEPTIKHKGGDTLWLNSRGCVHDLIAKHLPQLAKYIKWHLCSSDEPLHYVANTVYLVGDKDYWGLRKGEMQQFKDKDSGLPLWELTLEDVECERLSGQLVIDSEAEPIPVTIRWKPYGRIGEGKERELDAARRAAIWPEATDEELTDSFLKERLLARLPQLLEEFRKAVEELGFTF